MEHVVSLVGLVVSAVRREYQPFTDRSGRTMPGGVTCALWVVTLAEAEPVRVKCTAEEAALFGKALADGGGPVSAELRCRLFANGNRLDHSLAGYDFR